VSTCWTWPVGSLKPNDLGFFDAHGNAFTWCQETFKEDYPVNKGDEAAEDQEDGLAVNGTESRVLRGGSFDNQPSYVRSSYRSYAVPTNRVITNGLRAARTITP
jgi:formylglycine-generating enzyme required for sulfatase activity